MDGTEKDVLVSIIVPVYNVEAYLKQCIESLIYQTYKNIEIILIDDGSADTSAGICDMYAEQDRRIKVYHKENGGVSSARNAGIDMASGKYLIFVDADDCICRDLIDVYMQCADPGLVLMCGLSPDEQILQEDVCRKTCDTAYYDQASFMEVFRQNYINSPVNKLYSTQIIREQKIYFQENKNLGEDLLFNLEYFRYAPARYQVILRPLYYYRENRSGSLSTSYRSDLFEIQQELFEALRSFLKDTGAWSLANQAIYFGMYWDRLYLTVKMCRAYEEEHVEECRLADILRSSIWKQIWKECKDRKLLNIKRRAKAISLLGYKLYSKCGKYSKK